MSDLFFARAHHLDETTVNVFSSSGAYGRNGGIRRVPEFSNWSQGDRPARRARRLRNGCGRGTFGRVDICRGDQRNRLEARGNHIAADEHFVEIYGAPLPEARAPLWRRRKSPR